MKTKTSSDSGGKKAQDGKIIRWLLTILIILAVIGLEFFLFTRYSLWFAHANLENSKSTGANKSSSTRYNPIFGPPSSGTQKPSPEIPEQHFRSSPVKKSPVIGPASPSPQHFHPVPPAGTGPQRDIVNPAALKLIEKSPKLTFYRGVLELESRNDLLFSPDREKRLLKICKKIYENKDNPSRKDEYLKEGQRVFFGGLNEKQMNFVVKNMASWSKDKGYQAPEGMRLDDYMLKLCIELLEQRAKVKSKK